MIYNNFPLIIGYGSQSFVVIDQFSELMGKLNEKLAPTPFELFSAQILPPCASIMPFEIKSPKPVP